MVREERIATARSLQRRTAPTAVATATLQAEESISRAPKSLYNGSGLFEGVT
jgi:hypothetical protein